MTKDEFKSTLRRLQRQLGERGRTVEQNKRPFQHYENKRLEFVRFIDEALKSDWFVMPKKTSIIYKIYNNIIN